MGEEEPISNVRTLPFANLGVGEMKSVDLTLLEPDAIEKLSLSLTGGVTDINRYNHGKSDKPEIIKVEKHDVTLYSGKVSLDKLHASDYLFLKRNGCYTAIVVLGSSDLRTRVWCERDDNDRRIGAYSPDAPIFVAASDAWTSLRLNAHVYDSGDILEYTILAMSGKSLPGRELVFEIIGRHLTEIEVDGQPINGKSVSQVVKWLVQTLDANFTSEDIETAESPEVRELLNHLAGLKNSGSLKDDEKAEKVQ